MNYQNILLILILCAVCLIFIIGRFKLNSIPLSSPLTQTCLQSHDAHIRGKSSFHISMVHFKSPITLSHWVKNKNGFEIGAPSITTWGDLGVYDSASRIDTTNFASNTIWIRGLNDGSPFIWKNETKGIQYIRDAVDLNGISNEIYDFVCASDVLEHIANPFKALLEWIRIMRSGGLLLIIVPFKNVTFDHKRDVIQIEHLIDDYKNDIKEDDNSHIDEVLRLHDLQRDWAAGSFEAFQFRTKKNFELRGIHHHVFDQEILYNIFKCLNLKIIIQFTWDYHHLIIGQKH